MLFDQLARDCLLSQSLVVTDWIWVVLAWGWRWRLWCRGDVGVQVPFILTFTLGWGSVGRSRTMGGFASHR